MTTHPPGRHRLALAMLTTFGLGYLKPASGTWGSIPPVAIAWLILTIGWLLAPDTHITEPATRAAATLGNAWPPLQWAIYHAALITILGAFSLACITWGDVAEATFRRKDPGQVVADETAGQCLPLMFLPWSAVSDPLRAAITLGCLFIAFRLFDIVKPWPAGRLQALRGGWGILVDDLIVGLQLAVLAQLVLWALF